MMRNAVFPAFALGFSLATLCAVLLGSASNVMTDDPSAQWKNVLPVALGGTGRSKIVDACTLNASGTCSASGFGSTCNPSCTVQTITGATVQALLGVGCTNTTGTVTVQTGLGAGVGAIGITILCF